MKLTTLLLVGSFTLNALLLACWWRGRTVIPTAAKNNVGAAAVVTPAGRGAASVALPALSPSALRTALQRAELPRDVVDAIVAARIYRRFETRCRALFAQTLALPWWQTAAAGPSGLSLMTPAQRRELRELEAEARNETLRLLGPQALDPDGAIAMRHAFVSAEKAVLLDGLLHDYRDLGETLRDETLGIRTAADRENEELLERERQRDLAKLLSGDELERFELRTNRFASAMQRRSFGFQPTVAEYRAVLAAHQSFDARYPATSSSDRLMQPYRFAEIPEFQEELRALLGPARYAEWSRSGQTHYHTLESLGREIGLAAETTRSLAISLSDASALSWEIYENAQIPTADKRPALAELAAKAKAELTSKLGAAGQAQQLMEALAFASPTYVRGGAADSTEIDWAAVDHIATGILNPTQLTAWNASAARARKEAQLRKWIKGTNSP